MARSGIDGELWLMAERRLAHRFIVSTGRTGTVAIARDINARALNATAVHEPRPRVPVRLVGGVAMDTHVPKWICAAAWRAAHLRRHGASELLVESNPTLQGMVPYVAGAYPESRFLHVVRDPRDFIRSAVNFGATRAKRWVKWNFPGWEPARVKHQVREAERRLCVADLASREALRVAHRWAILNRYYESMGATLGERYRLVRFEDIFSSTGSSYVAALDWLGVRLDPERSGVVTVHNASSAGLMGHYDELPDRVRGEIMEICGPMARRYGYRCW